MTQNFVYQKCPNQIFPLLKFVLSHGGHFGLEGGGGPGGLPPLLLRCTVILLLPWQRSFIAGDRPALLLPRGLRHHPKGEWG